LLVASQGWQRIKLPARDLAYCFLLGTLGVAISNYFLLRRGTENECRHCDHRAIHRSGVGSVLCGGSRPAKAFSLQKVVAVALAVTGIALVIGIVGTRLSDGRALRLDSYGLIAALLASFSFAFYNVAGAPDPRPLRPLARTRLDAHRGRGLLAGRQPSRGRVVAAHYAPAQWLFLFVFSMISVLGAILALLPRPAASRTHVAPSSPVAWSRCSPLFSPLCC
jgi:hypothetical protein